MLVGKKILLVPMTAGDKEQFYRWATASDATLYWYGELYGDKVPGRSEFFGDWKDHYFNDSGLQHGRCFKIIVQETGAAIGQVNYQKIEEEPGVYDLDIIIASDNDKNKGYGSEALQLLAEYLNQALGVRSFCIHALADNTRAIRSYLKAGFKIENNYNDDRNLVWAKMTLNKE